MVGNIPFGSFRKYGVCYKAMQFFFLVCSADLYVLCSGLFWIWVVCVNAKHPKTGQRLVKQLKKDNLSKTIWIDRTVQRIRSC